VSFSLQPPPAPRKREPVRHYAQVRSAEQYTRLEMAPVKLKGQFYAFTKAILALACSTGGQGDTTLFEGPDEPSW
jgi:hypothetical protein